MKVIAIRIKRTDGQRMTEALLRKCEEIATKAIIQTGKFETISTLIDNELVPNH